MLLVDLEMGDLGFNLRLEFVRSAAQFGKQTSSLPGDLRQLLWPKYNQGQEEQEDRLGKTHGLIIMSGVPKRQCFEVRIG